MLPHEGNLVIVDQLSYTQKVHLDTSESSVPLINQSSLANESLGVRMYTLFMGTFDMHAPINYLGSMSVGKNISTVVDKIEPCVLPS